MFSPFNVDSASRLLGPTATSWTGHFTPYHSWVRQWIDSPSMLVYLDKDSSPIKWPNWALTIALLNCVCKCTWLERVCQLILPQYRSPGTWLYFPGHLRLGWPCIYLVKLGCRQRNKESGLSVLLQLSFNAPWNVVLWSAQSVVQWHLLLSRLLFSSFY